jgi:ribosome-binding protein aMBF1 (putative translation factor)
MAIPVIDAKATGLNIWKLREERGISTKGLTEMINPLTTPSMIYKWQDGKYLPSAENLFKLSKIFDVPMEKILVFKEETE